MHSRTRPRRLLRRREREDSRVQGRSDRSPPAGPDAEEERLAMTYLTPLELKSLRMRRVRGVLKISQ